MTDTTTWTHAADVAQVAEGERYVLLDLGRPAVPPRVLSGPAAVIWSAVDGARDTAAVISAVAEAVGMDTAELHADVTTFLAELHDSGLLVGPTETAT